MTPEQKALCRNRIFHHFYQISQIPHESGNEKEISDYLLSWAQALGLEASQDAFHNVFIRKPASPGYEKAPGVMIQAHMDMVCVKAEGVEHDFSKDPIEWVIAGDILSTGGKTSLGADDGIGVAYAMAILEDPQLKHPMLEVLFTTNEEDDFSGATGFDLTQMQASYLINIDHTADDELICGCCGGMRVDFSLVIPKQSVPEEWSTYRLSLSGLKGGHSGEDIHRGRGNANALLGRLLMGIEGSGEILLSELTGGSTRVAIAREASAILSMSSSILPEMQARLSQIERDMQNEFAVTGTNLLVKFEPWETAARGVPISKIISALTIMPDGIIQMNELLTGLVDTSTNMGEIHFKDGTLQIVHEIRSAHDSLGEYLFQRINRLALLLGGECRKSCLYPGWTFKPGSRFVNVCSEVYENLYGQKPKCSVVHAGMEVGCFCGGQREIEAVSIGPNYKDYHSPAEAMEISSAKKVYQYLCGILEAIR